MQILTWPKTPLGPLWAELDGHSHLTALHWGQASDGAEVVTAHPLYKALAEYFTHPTQHPPFSHKDFAPKGTAFQQKVWHALLDIAPGTTRTYGDLAAALKSSPRAIGGAVGSNPIPILIPCHRVMGQGGKLTGFSAPGGLKTKTWLLQHEGVSLL
ncbi:MAG: methylated-DNA--[protein]-cysteine S-methyltransferase [Proteobacteria bacterium]|nr:methylated-DNA--[protein]-cysteine S-methyltransferase [Pseudomonadota bacterium]